MLAVGSLITQSENTIATKRHKKHEKRNLSACSWKKTRVAPLPPINPFL
jgi:hypothetical protein